MSYPKPHLNAARRRARKRTLARRDGALCTYCRIPFTDLRQATMDHVVPLSLYRTWRAADLVLACRPCNTAKSNRLPLLMALLLCATVDRDAEVTQVSSQMPPVATPVVTTVTPRCVTLLRELPAGVREHLTRRREHSADGVHGRPIGAVHEQPIGAVREHSREHVHGSIGEAFTPDWALLARLAHARQTADRSTAAKALQERTPLGRKGEQAPDRTPNRSMCDLPVRTAASAVRGRTDRPYAGVRIGRTGACGPDAQTRTSRPTDEAVCA
ncbi:HNH endonuclease [Streptomyces sp. NRRL S-337]|uniref:HNH endonuclease n=1 Tax=Streptomyces sp. NRRL S-337 TaxID=1463900 RepID=UPI00099D1276|nr:HNH endonuclease signature motif containing protein [Streptomyces sp. NRRL S-337]